MKSQKLILIMISLLLVSTLVLGYFDPVFAAQRDSITKALVYQKPLDIFLGKGGVYFPSSNYTGKAVLSRIKPIDTKNLTFTHRWLDIYLFDTNGKAIKSAGGFVYVYFNLNTDDLAAWNKEKLSIYQFDRAKSKWVDCPTYYFANKSAPNGRVSCLVTGEFGRFGIAIKR